MHIPILMLYMIYITHFSCMPATQFCCLLIRPRDILHSDVLVEPQGIPHRR